MKFVILRYSSLFWWILITFTPFALLWRIGDFLFYPIARKIAWRDLPKVANKLGLEYTKSTSYSEFGMLSGKVNGYQFFISPDSGHIKLALIHLMWVDSGVLIPSFVQKQWNCFRRGCGICGQPFRAAVQGEVGKSVWRWSGDLHWT